MARMSNDRVSQSSGTKHNRTVYSSRLQRVTRKVQQRLNQPVSIKPHCWQTWVIVTPHNKAFASLSLDQCSYVFE